MLTLVNAASPLSIVSASYPHYIEIILFNFCWQCSILRYRTQALPMKIPERFLGTFSNWSSNCGKVSGKCFCRVVVLGPIHVHGHCLEVFIRSGVPSMSIVVASNFWARGTLISQPQFSTPCDMQFFPRDTGKMGFFEGLYLKMAFSPYRMGKIACRKG